MRVGNTGRWPLGASDWRGRCQQGNGQLGEGQICRGDYDFPVGGNKEMRNETRTERKRAPAHKQRPVRAGEDYPISRLGYEYGNPEEGRKRRRRAAESGLTTGVRYVCDH